MSADPFHRQCAIIGEGQSFALRNRATGAEYRLGWIEYPFALEKATRLSGQREGRGEDHRKDGKATAKTHHRKIPYWKDSQINLGRQYKSHPVFKLKQQFSPPEWHMAEAPLAGSPPKTKLHHFW
jgi:hypothetical protein